MAAPERWVVSCEHGGHRVPRRYAPLFRGAARVLRGHEGFDPGALAVARRLARRLRAPLVASEVTRLLVDLNRSLHHPRVFSRIVAALPRTERQRIVATHYLPHRHAVEREIALRIARRARVIHLAVHSFTPLWRGRSRRTDIALLYDPQRRHERELCARWRAALRAAAPELRIRRNHPYRGSADGLTSALRRRFPARSYLGIELELSQGQLARAAGRRRVLEALERSLAVLEPSRSSGAQGA